MTKGGRDPLTRVVKFLSARGLPFRDDVQQQGSTTNGLFLGCLQLLSELDPFLSPKRATRVKGTHPICRLTFVARCPTCNPYSSRREEDIIAKLANTYAAETSSLTKRTFLGKKGLVYTDRESSHSIATENMYRVFKDKELTFQETNLTRNLADGQQTEVVVLTTQNVVDVESRSILIKFIILLKKKGKSNLTRNRLP
ncbi:hypothetical protein TNIN_499141 [Trichonephila inaurata madagascariensis]|uniref:Uncharacterized protein n=1 Tax=Trichonephila inaurata madagascariensis TaxID=2747483 RepID=A0A8X7BR59_9ARAC|nr:hypothetical protein TNIN_499141 [Trichonephila inaurata madagascariensis]